MDSSTLEPVKRPARASVVRTVVIAGNPNSGKSTLFNALTGMRQKVGNYPGVTVEKLLGRFAGAHGEPIDILDLPGTYSLQTRSPDEAVARDAILGRIADTAAPDVIVSIVDASNLERNLYLTAQLAELGLPMVVALTMVDLAERNGLRTDPAALARRLGCPVVPVVAPARKGLVELRQAITAQLRGVAPQRAPLPDVLEAAAAGLGGRLARDQGVPPRFAFAEALLLLSACDTSIDEAVHPSVRPHVDESRRALESAGLDRLSAAVQARYAWAQELATAAQRRHGANAATSDRIDAVLTHRLWGWVFFLGVMALMFFAMFRLAEFPMGWIESAQELVSGWAAGALPEGDFRDLVIDGVIAGVGGVVIFLPQILILFFFLGLLEDTGYMARATFIMDRLMSKVGLHGKSFVPMLSGFACAIPGIMAARTIDNKKDRFVTTLVVPLVSCSARLPVYALLIAVLLPATYSAWTRTGIMLGLYLLGLGAAFAMAWLFRKTLFKGEHSLLLLEMPPYRRPSLRVTLHRMWERSVMFLKRAGTAILAISIIIWALSTYPKHPDPDASASDALAYSVAGRLGHAIEPVLTPMGGDWKIGVGVISSFAAREVFVGTMSIIYSIENGEEDTGALREAMLGETRDDGTPLYTPLLCVSLLVFYVLAMQCLPTTAVVRRELGSWKWALFQLGYMTVLAWGAATLVYQGGRLLGLA